MRTSCAWFSDRAQRVWKAQPGRSMLLLVPQGCDEPATADQVASWALSNFTAPSAFNLHKPLMIRMTCDAFPTSEAFSRAFAREVGKALDAKVQLDEDYYPTEIIENSVRTALSADRFPVLILQRFHAFASIRDGGMGSVLAGMRELEHAGNLTTLAISPAGYDDIRAEMSAELPFLNSVYGDNHDRAIMTPLNREQFVANAVSRGIASHVAHRLFIFAGGPDDLCSAILDNCEHDKVELVNACIVQKSGMLEKFAERSFPKLSQGDLADLALGKLSRPQEAFIKASPLWKFIAKESPSGRLICSSQILARFFLQAGETTPQKYDRCLKCFAEGDFHTADEIAQTLFDENIRLQSFIELIKARSSLDAKPGRGFLGADIDRASHALHNLRGIEDALHKDLRCWVETMSKWCILIQEHGRESSGRLEAAKLARASKHRDVRFSLLYLLVGLLHSMKSENRPNIIITNLVNVPETILQALACGLCDLDVFHCPDEYPVADFDKFFGGRSQFRLPSKGKTMTLSTLLVVVPALLPTTYGKSEFPFSQPEVIKPLQQKLVDRLRNIASHTIAGYNDNEAQFLLDLCSEWLESWARLEGFSSTSEIPGVANAPSPELLADLLFGSDERGNLLEADTDSGDHGRAG